MRGRRRAALSVLLLTATAAAAPDAPPEPAGLGPSSRPSDASPVAATNPSNPTTGPATRPGASALPATAATPKDALKLFAAALRDGDADKLRDLVLTVNPVEDRMLGAIADQAAALARLNRAAAKAFGEQEAARFTDDGGAHFSETLARIDAAEVTPDGAKATVRYADAKETPFELHKAGGLWKVPMTAVSPDADPAALGQRLEELKVQTKIVSELAEEITAGKYPNADAAEAAWRAKFMRTLPTRPPAAGQEAAPATRSL